MKRLGILVGAAAALIIVAVGGTAFFTAQRADYGWKPRVGMPAFTSAHPAVLYDEGHHNASRIGFTGRYWPFGRLLRADGFDLRRGRQPFTPAAVGWIRVLVIANASGAAKPQMFIADHAPFGQAASGLANALGVTMHRGFVEVPGEVSDPLVEAPAGAAQGLAFTLGQGRVVVLGEAGMVTAQVARRERYGMNTPDNDNRQFVLNVMHWLAGRL